MKVAAGAFPGSAADASQDDPEIHVRPAQSGQGRDHQRCKRDDDGVE
jgi:hypothetical protein